MFILCSGSGSYCDGHLNFPMEICENIKKHNNVIHIIQYVYRVRNRSGVLLRCQFRLYFCRVSTSCRIMDVTVARVGRGVYNDGSCSAYIIVAILVRTLCGVCSLS